MASISSTNSTSSLGNTSLRGFGGMASGIDRDSIIEQMTLGTTTKISNQKKAMTQLQWKQEAYRGLTDKIIDMEDKYFSYSSGSSLKDATVFGRNKISIHGSDESAKFVTATGTSSLVDNVSIKGVQQLATSSVQRSAAKIDSNGLTTGLSSLEQKITLSDLRGTILELGTYDAEGKWTSAAKFTFSDTYTDESGKTHTIDYLQTNQKELVNQLNEALKYSGQQLGSGNDAKKIGEIFEFTLDNNKIKLVTPNSNTDASSQYVIHQGSTALEALGYKSQGTGDEPEGINFKTFNEGVQANNDGEFVKANRHDTTALDYMKGKKLVFNYDGQEKEIELITDTEYTTLKEIVEGTKTGNSMESLVSNLQSRLDKAFGENAVKAEIKTVGSNEVLTFTTKGDSTVSVKSSDSDLLRGMGLEYGSSNKVNMDGKLGQNALKIDDATINGGLVINGVTISGITKDSTISDILSKINSNKDVGVRATYVDATGQFMLVSTETGKGRNINLESDLAKELFGNEVTTTVDGKQVDKGFTEGQNAIVYVSYGNGINVGLERSSNTFNLEGLNVTVSGTFGVKTDESGKLLDSSGNVITDENGKPVVMDAERAQFDTSKTVTFTAKADVDGVTEKVKTFFEDFNALVTEIGTQVRTRPDNSYGPLTDEQKAEMDETSIKNWENKAKQGVLYGESAVRDLSAAIEGIFTRMMQNGASYEDLKAIGITYSEDYLDGGTLVFDESKFRDAMESNPDKVASIFTGGGGVSKGLIDVVDETFCPYATRYSSKNGNSYGRFIEVAGSEKKPTSLLNNEIYKQLKEMEDTIASLQERLKTEQDRYISQFTTMESLINQMNTQQSYLSQITG